MKLPGWLPAGRAVLHGFARARVHALRPPAYTCAASYARAVLLARASTLAWVMAAMQLGLPSPQAHADGLRCGTKLVVEGDTQYDVRRRCGEPVNQVHRMELRTVRQWIAGPCRTNDPRSCGQFVERSVEVAVDEWTYDFGPHAFVQYLTFEDGRLFKIVSGSRGTRDP
jgi:hypothetical protein